MCVRCKPLENEFSQFFERNLTDRLTAEILTTRILKAPRYNDYLFYGEYCCEFRIFFVIPFICELKPHNYLIRLYEMNIFDMILGIIKLFEYVHQDSRSEEKIQSSFLQHQLFI